MTERNGVHRYFPFVFYPSRLTATAATTTLKRMNSHNALHRIVIVWMPRWAAKLSPVRVPGRIHRQ